MKIFWSVLEAPYGLLNLAGAADDLGDTGAARIYENR
jgi:hypothetical protein